MRVGALIPSIGHADTLPALTDTLTTAGIPTAVVCNRADRVGDVSTMLLQRTFGPVPRLIVRDGWSLYRVWNLAIRAGRVAGFDLVAIFNDDVTLDPDAIPTMVAALEGRPDVWLAGFDYRAPSPRHRPGEVRPVQGTFRHGGIGGFAFAVRPCCVPTVDESFVWWGGDDDLVFGTYAAGGEVAIVDGAYVWHPTDDTSARHYPELAAAKAADLERVIAKWET